MGQFQNTSKELNHSFTKGLNKDSDPSFVGEGMWTHARNVVNNSKEGDLGSLSNDTSNYLCATAGSTMPLIAQQKFIIGVIHLFSGNWLIFTAGHNALGIPVMSEIGLLEESSCLYRPIVQDACLGFDKRYLISGSSRKKEDCSWQAYWADGLNPDRYINVGDPQTWPLPNEYTWLGLPITNPSTVNYYVDNLGNQILWPGVKWKQLCDDNVGCVQLVPGVWPPNCPTVNSCITCTNINELDCEKSRLARLMDTPCLKTRLGPGGGTLKNGTYFAVIAYLIKGIKVTDYFSPSNSQPVYHPDDLRGSLVIDVEADSVNFSEFSLVIVQNVNEATIAKKFGIYSTKTRTIQIDQLPMDLVTVPLSFIPIQTPIFEKSDQIAEVNSYLLRVGPTSKFDFNYQPLANQISAKWTSVEYPSNYYTKGGNKTSYLRDEVYAFFIRWIYDTGDKSASYHIPGRPPRNFTNGNVSGNETTDNINDLNTLDNTDQLFEMYNTASSTGVPTLIGTTTDDGGIILDSGDMGYWESTEVYPDTIPEIWNSSSHCWTGPIGQSGLYDLCGKPIRHHKFPDNYLNVNTVHFRKNTVTSPPNPQANEGLAIRLMGVRFENIILPKDNDGVDITGIVGYEILRGSREGNQSIIAKGMINNLRTYEIKGSVQRNRIGLYPNYPFNTIIPPMNLFNTNDNNYAYNDPFIRMPHKPNDYSVVDNQTIPTDIITFHSPDLMFSTPFLDSTEIKLYGHLQGQSSQYFAEPNGHPKWKLLADAAVLIATLVGIGEAIISIIGKRVYNQPGSSFTQQRQLEQLIYGETTVSQSINSAEWNAYTLGPLGPRFIYQQKYNAYFNSGQGILDAFTGTDFLDGYLNTFNKNGGQYGTYTAPALDRELTWTDYIPAPVQIAFDVLGGISKFLYYFSEGADVALKVIQASIRYDQYALQQIGHGFYDNMLPPLINKVQRFKMEDSFYIRDNIQEVPYYLGNVYNSSNAPITVPYRYSINNLKRSPTVVVRTKTGNYYNPILFPTGANIGPAFIQDAAGNYIDNSLVTLGYFQNDHASNAGQSWGPPANPTGAQFPSFDNISIPFAQNIASHYAGIKVRLRNQYGQLNSIKQVVITPCEQKSSTYKTALSSYTCLNENFYIKTILATPVFFGGDTYVNRYTEKNTMFFFYDWLYGQPDGFEFNYLLHQMVPEPRFWANSKAYDITDLAPTNWSNPTPGTGALPTKFYNLDNRNYNYEDDSHGNYPGTFRVKESFFYLAVSSVRDFFVESDIIVDFRKPTTVEAERFYDPYNYTDLPALFNMNPDVIAKGDVYRYDYSLSISKSNAQYSSAGNLQNRNYNPNVSQLCYVYYQDRLYYSNPQQNDSYNDAWFIYLANNYNQFKSQLSGVKSINKSGLFITFKNASPLMYQGVDTLQTEIGTKITIGDGGLFSQPGQSVTNADVPYEYGSSQSRLSVISSPAGLYYISQNQGKIFSYAGGLKEISQIGLKWWFNLFLPYKLTEDFPEYPYKDNPVAGIGCQTLYDNENSILYFCKKDYKLKPETDRPVGTVTYVPLITTGKKKGQGDYFQIEGSTGQFQLGDELLFEDASWTTSFDPKNEFWLSYHDWHPDLVIPNKGKFLTTKTNQIWKHNDLCANFCNYYGTPFPFEIEFPIITGQTITTLKSIDYVLECYRRSEVNCIDQHHVLDVNFDRAVIFNTEQVSGHLNLNLFPKNNVTLSLDYPKLNVNQNSYDILFSKEENKYKFNQYWDITRDRGEFPIGSNYPPTGPVIPGSTLLLGNYDNENIWITEANGYKKKLNVANIDYNKPQMQRKKFRHYINFLNLTKDVSGDINMLLKLVNTKNQISPR